MFSTHFLVGHPFGDPLNPEDIFEGPFATREAAQDALDTHLANNGHPGRVVTLSEVVAPRGFCVLLRPDCNVVGSRLIGSLAQAQATVREYSALGLDYGPTIYGLVPVKES